MASNQAAWLDEKGSNLRVGDAPMPVPGPDEIVIRNHAIAVNPLDWHMQENGLFVQQWPAILGSDVAGEVYQVGASVTRFKKGDRVIGHAINLETGKPQDAAFALYTVTPAAKTAKLPSSIPYTDGVVLPLALETAVIGLVLKQPVETMPHIIPGLLTPALGLPYPRLNPQRLDKTLVIYGGSSSVGSLATQIAAAIGLNVIAITSAKNFELSKMSGANEVFDYKDAQLVEKVVRAVGSNSFAGIFDAISVPESYAHDLQIMTKLGGGPLACTHPPPTDNLPEQIEAGMIWAVNDVANAVWEDYVTPALESGKLKCLPQPLVVGKGLESIQQALEKSKAGVSGTKLVIDLS